MLSEAVKLLKVQYLVKAIDAHKMDQAIIFCRTKLDCDNAESYLVARGGGQSVAKVRFLVGWQNHQYHLAICMCVGEVCTTHKSV